MGLKSDLIIAGVIIGGIILFRDKIGSAFAQTGEVLGSSIGGGFKSFFDSFASLAQPSTSITTETDRGTITTTTGGLIPPPEPTISDVGGVEVFQSGGFLQATGGTLEQQAEAIDQTNLLDTAKSLLGGLFGPIIGPAFAEPEQFIGPPDLRLNPDQPLNLFDFAQRFNIQPSEAFEVQKDFGGLDFEAIAAIPTFGEVLAENPELTASGIANLKLIQAGGGEDFDFGTNLGNALELAKGNFGQAVLQPEIPFLKEAEALRAQATLGGGSGGLFASPEFPITLGEAFLGKSGTVVSQSISNLNQGQLKDFIERFG